MAAAWTKTKCCATCALYPVEKVLDAAGKLRKNLVARCQWKSAEVWPVSARGHGFDHAVGGHIQPLEGTDCPCYMKRDENREKT